MRRQLVSILGLVTTAMLGHSAMAVTEETFRSLLDEIQNALIDGHSMLEDNSLSKQIEDFEIEVDGLRTLQQQLLDKEVELDRLVALANTKQVEHLISRLNETLEKETSFRKLVAQLVNHDDEDEVEESNFVDKETLKELIKPDEILRVSESEISDWILSIARESIDKYNEDILALASEQPQTKEDESCPSILDVVQDVQVALTRFSQDVIGLIDHAQGAEIVHSMTSPTFTPVPGEEELLGNVWWRRYIPEDLERLLPEGWESWNVDIPAYIYHSLNMNGGISAPPETILEKTVVPGSCWPLDGSSGQVTFRLPYTIKVESFSVDHVPWHITPEESIHSAPKTIKVIAYPPCNEINECGALGFDALDPMEVAQFEYDIEGKSVQTFDSIFMSHESDEGDDDASCTSGAATACTTPPKIDIAAITVQVLENHGNPDYTCMYRVRVHGEQVL